MKKLIIFIAMALMAVSANAQTSLLKVNYEGVTEFTHWFGSNEGTDATLEMVADGVAINNPRVQDQIWTPQAVMTDDCLTLEEDYNYIVRITLKVPSDGSYQVQFGSWSTNFQYEVPVTASDEWQTIDVEFPEFGGTVEGDGHVVFQCGWVVGKTIIKEVQVIGELDNTTFNPANIKYNYIAKGKVAEVISNNGKYRGIVEIPAKVTYEGEEYTVTKICDNAFSDCKRLSSIIIPNSVTSIGSYAFSGCSSLTSVTIPNSVTSIGDGIFQNCYNLTSIIIPNSVTSIGSYAFSGCSSLTSITIPNSVTSIGSYAFHCSGLTSVIIPNSVKSLGSCAFYGCI